VPLTVAIFRAIFLPYSETFIYDSLQKYTAFKPIVIAQRRINEDKFPNANVITPREKMAGRVDSFVFSSGIRSNAMYREFQKWNPAIVHAHFGQSGVLAIAYAKAARIPLIVTLHGNDVGILLGRQRFKPKCWFYALSLKRLIKETTLFLADSQELKDRFVSLGCPANKVRVHLLGVDLNRFSPKETTNSDDNRFITMVGRLVEKKGFEYGIRAFANLSTEIRTKQQARLFIIGDGPLMKKLLQLSNNLGVQDKVKFMGALPHHRVNAILRDQTDILMAPSVIARNQDRDSGLIVAKEASACGIPVIGNRHGGIPDIIEHEKTGFLIEERDIEALSKALKILIETPKLRHKLGMAARQKMLRDYDINDRMSELEAIYRGVIANDIEPLSGDN